MCNIIEFCLTLKAKIIFFSKYDDGTRIAQIWIESADNYCRTDEPQFNRFMNNYKKVKKSIQCDYPIKFLQKILV